MSWTHYHIDKDDRITLFNIGECEGCSQPVQEPNAVTGKDPASHYEGMGMWKWDGPTLPPEIVVHDDGSTCCEDCEHDNTGTGKACGCEHCEATFTTAEEAEAHEAYHGLFEAARFVVNDIPTPGEDAELTVDGYNRLCKAIADAKKFFVSNVVGRDPLTPADREAMERHNVPPVADPYTAQELTAILPNGIKDLEEWLECGATFAGVVAELKHRLKMYREGRDRAEAVARAEQRIGW